MQQAPSTAAPKDNFVVACREDDCGRVIDEAGSAQCLVTGCDYPHAEGLEASKDFAPKALIGHTDVQVRGLTYTNGRRFLPKAA